MEELVHPHEVRIIGIQRDHEQLGAGFFGKSVRVGVDDIEQLKPATFGCGETNQQATTSR
jgi:hypothetical protein